MQRHLLTLDGRFWRMLFKEWAGDLLAPARSPEGRFHYGGQSALYLSGTPEGCVIASQRYMKSNDPQRAIYPVNVVSDRILDLRDPSVTAHYNVDVTHRAAKWQTIRRTGLPSPTWDISDKVRELKFHGMLYASRTDPQKTHLTLFKWNTSDGADVIADGAAMPWHLSKN